MTDQDKELRMRISMLLDSDLEGRDNPRLIDKLEENPELRATWARYNVIGDVIRGSGGRLADIGFAERVTSVIASEPTVLAPRLPKNVANNRRNVIAVSLAASLAAAVVLVGHSVRERADVFQMVSSVMPSSNRLVAKAPDSTESQADSRFNDYLVMHNEAAYMTGSAGTLSYVRLVGSGPNH